MAIYMSNESWLPKQPIKCGKLDYFCMVYMRVARQQETHLIYYLMHTVLKWRIYIYDNFRMAQNLYINQR